MSQETNINCDCCGEKLNVVSSYPHNYCLHLCSVDRGLSDDSGFQYAILQYPPIDKDLDFCGLACLEKWVKERAQ